MGRKGWYSGQPDGTLDAFWLGLEKMYQLIKSGNWHILLMAKHKTGTYAEKWSKLVYDHFQIGDKASGYKLTFGAKPKKENSRESSLFHYQKNMKFSTKDRDNDESSYNCAAHSIHGRGRWWYKTCSIINLNRHNSYWRPEGTLMQMLMVMQNCIAIKS
jgi:hypothetical protein